MLSGGFLTNKQTPAVPLAIQTAPKHYNRLEDMCGTVNPVLFPIFSVELKQLEQNEVGIIIGHLFTSHFQSFGVPSTH